MRLNAVWREGTPLPPFAGKLHEGRVPLSWDPGPLQGVGGRE